MKNATSGVRLIGSLLRVALGVAALGGGCDAPAMPVDGAALVDAGATDSVASALVDLAVAGTVDASLVQLDASMATLTIDCTLAAGLCPTLDISGDAPAMGSVHGYADPSMRKDPNSGNILMAYSWPRTLSDKSLVVDFHLAHSGDGGGTWSFDGALFATSVFANPGSGKYAPLSNTSAEVVDLLPIDRNGATKWVQAHLAYLVPNSAGNIYAQLNSTNYISVSAFTVGNPVAAGAGAVLGLGKAKEARLGAAETDATLNPTVNLASLDPALARCEVWNQPALYAAGGTLYLAAQCSEIPNDAGVTVAELAFQVFSTPLGGDDATKWVWSYVGQMAAPSQAQKLGAAEGAPYEFFTELQIASGANGQLLAILSPSVLVKNGHQPVTQYGCRAIPITAMAKPALQVDNTGTPVVAATVTDGDLYTNGNQGPGACTYEAASSTGIAIVRKLEADPMYGFYVTLQSSGVRP